MKKIIIVLLILVAVILIYNTKNKKINYISLSDNIMNNYLEYEDYNTYLKNYLVKRHQLRNFTTNFINKSISLINKDIQNNRTINYLNEEKYLKKVLRESDYVVISIGMEEIIKKYDKYDMDKNKEMFSKKIQEIKELIVEIKKYAHGTIIFLGYYNPTDYYDSKVDNLFYDIDVKINRLMMQNDDIYIDLYELVKGNKFKNHHNNYLLNSLAHKKIADIIAFYL